jgi:hypothetical protein
MSYLIKKTDGTLLAEVADGAKNTSATGLTLPGPNYVGYGAELNENLVYLLENFASESDQRPIYPSLEGQLWFNKTSQRLEVFTRQNGETYYSPVSGITNSGIQPHLSKESDIWFNQNTNQMFINDAGTFKLIGPQYTKAMGVSGAIPTVLSDGVNIGVTHDIVRVQFGDVTLATFSRDSFIPTPAITGFPTIYSGLTINENLLSGSAQFYTNANTSAYLPTDATIIGINNTISTVNSTLTDKIDSANAAIITANVGMLSYVNDLSTAGNLSLQGAVNSLMSYVNSTVATSESNSAVLISNVQSYVNSTLSNVTAANAAIASVSSAWQANAVTQQTQINTLQTQVYANANVATYLPAYGGNISAATVTATTPAYNDSSTRVATTAYVNSVLPRGAIIMWGGAINAIPAGWQLCDGSNSTPNLRDRFVVGAGSSYAVNNTGGNTSISIATTNLPAHTHSVSLTGTSGAAGGHLHSATSTVSDPGHAHTVPDYAIAAGVGLYPSYYSGYAQTQVTETTTTVGTGVSVGTTVAAVADHTHTLSLSGTSGSTGSGTSIDTRPPYYALCYIQKMY